MMEDINEQVKEIKQSFRQMMDGAVAQSMRSKGLHYHVNWGATLPMLREFADEIRETCDAEPAVKGTDGTGAAEHSRAYSLAIALWKEDVRECKLLATMLMPADEILPEIVDLWVEQIPTQEVAEQLSFNLWQHLPYAPEKAYQWLSSEQEYAQLCGFHVLSRLFQNGQEPNERGINEYIDQLLSALQGPYLSVKKAAYQSAIRFAGLGVVYERLMQSALKSIGMTL